MPPAIRRRRCPPVWPSRTRRPHRGALLVLFGGLALTLGIAACDANDAPRESSQTKAKPANTKPANTKPDDTKPDVTKPNTAAKPSVSGVPSPPTAAPTKTAPSGLTARIQAALCAKDNWFCAAEVKSFHDFGTTRDHMGFISLESADMDAATFAWTANESKLAVQRLVETADGSGGGVSHLVKTTDAALVDEALGVFSATLTIGEHDADMGGCLRSHDERTVQVVCALEPEFLCGALTVGHSSSSDTDAACCKKGELSGADCKPPLSRSTGFASTVGVDGTTWVVAAPTVTGDGKAPAALAGRHGVEAFINTYTVGPDGIEDPRP